MVKTLWVIPKVTLPNLKKLIYSFSFFREPCCPSTAVTRHTSQQFDRAILNIDPKKNPPKTHMLNQAMQKSKHEGNPSSETRLRKKQKFLWKSDVGFKREELRGCTLCSRRGCIQQAVLYRITAKYKAFQNNEGYYKNIKWHWNTLLKEKCAWVVEGKMQLVIMAEGMLTKYRHLKWENSIWENNPFNALLSCGSIPLFITFISQPASSFVTSQNQHNSIEITGITATDFKKDMI